MSELPRVLMLVPYPGIQGPLPKHLPLLVEGLRELGCPVDVDYWSRHADVESLHERILGRAADLWRVLGRLHRERYDLLYITTAHTWPGLARDIPLVWASHLACPHRIIKFHGSFSNRLVEPRHPLLKLASRVLLKGCDVALVLSREEREQWVRFRPDACVQVAANTFAPRLLASASALSPEDPVSGDIDDRIPTFLFVGRMMPQKGVLDLLRAFALVAARVPCRLILAGDGPSAGEVADEVEELGLQERAQLTGYVSGTQLAELYARSVALVLPTYWAEGFPTVYLEAMSAGLPIITTPLRGAADYLRHEVNALLVPPQEPALLAQAMERMLSDEPLRKSISSNNLELVRKFAPSAVAPRYLALFQGTVAS